MADKKVLPDLMQILHNLDTAMVYLLGSLRLLLFVIGFLWFFRAILNLYQVSVGDSSSKLFPTNARPTVAGSFIQMFVAGVLVALSYNMSPAVLVGALLHDNLSNIQMYSVASYNPKPTGREFQEMLYRFLVNIFYVVGFIAMWRGLSTWYNISQQTSNEPGSKVIVWLLMGGLCFFPEYLNGFIAALIGFDFFNMIFG